MHEAVLQIWREEADTQELHLVSDYKLKQDTSQDNLDDFICRNKTLSPQDYIGIHKNDVSTHMKKIPEWYKLDNVTGCHFWAKPQPGEGR